MNEFEIQALQRAARYYTGEEMERICATLVAQGYEQRDLPWIFWDLTRTELIANNRYPHVHRPLGPCRDPVLLEYGKDLRIRQEFETLSSRNNEVIYEVLKNGSPFELDYERTKYFK